MSYTQVEKQLWCSHCQDVCMTLDHAMMRMRVEATANDIVPLYHQEQNRRSRTILKNTPD